MKTSIVPIGEKIGRLTIIEEVPERSSDNRRMVKCKCDCGNYAVVRLYEILRKRTTSCGCMRGTKDGEPTRHGTRLYDVWKGMRARCSNPNHTGYSYYGGRGIKICPEWDDYVAFKKWAFTHGYDKDAPKGKCTLERIDSNKDYEPDNCKWVSMAEQNNNKRNSFKIKYKSETHTLSEWSKITGVPWGTIRNRYLAGYPLDEVFSHEKVIQRKESSLVKRQIPYTKNELK